ncbi:hypothetical protein ALQ02_200031 [Pseudomonas savastanoi pv. phaseolicola]|nr:hypothetical protein ALQ02_200031 [Pseudomonas savastanoi pv. phaseolicola]
MQVMRKTKAFNVRKPCYVLINNNGIFLYRIHKISSKPNIIYSQNRTVNLSITTQLPMIITTSI